MQKVLLEKNSFLKKLNHFAKQLSKSSKCPPQYRPKIGGTEGGICKEATKNIALFFYII